jgi:hypothetical protein
LVGLGALWYFRLSWFGLKLSWGISYMTAIVTFGSSLLHSKRNTAHLGRDRTTNMLTHIRVVQFQYALFIYLLEGYV